MKKTNPPILVVIVASLAIYTTSCNSSPQESAVEETPEAVATVNHEEIVNRGKYLVSIMGCNDCHSPKKMGPNGPEVIPELMLSGYPSDRPIVKFDDKLIKEGFAVFYPDMTAGAGPWGISFTGNLTPDETGIGNWTEEQFEKAIRQGKFKGLDSERMLLPPMPWQEFSHLTDEDVHAIFMYLKSIKPVRNVVPMPVAPDKM